MVESPTPPFVVYGVPLSSYVRTVRMTCAEKGVPHRFEPIQLGSSEHRRRHPFLKIPTASHGDFELFETSAICHYIDKAFEGPQLVPSAAKELARMEQWISVINCYVYRDTISNYVLQYVLPSLEGRQPDRAKIDAGLDAMKNAISELDRAYEGREWIAGTFGLADLFVGPVISSVILFPEGKQAIEASKNLPRVLTQLRGRASSEFLDPQPPRR
jgi:glutathione S-transferase